MKWFPRENYLSKIRGCYHATDIIKVITGVRRSGKSCLMETVAEELCAGGVVKDNIIYIDLDDQQYENVTTVEQLKELIASIISSDSSVLKAKSIANVNKENTHATFAWLDIDRYLSHSNNSNNSLASKSKSNNSSSSLLVEIFINRSKKLRSLLVSKTFSQYKLSFSPKSVSNSQKRSKLPFPIIALSSFRRD